jgi:putative endonuclease
VTNYSIGHKAEAEAAEYLKTLGYKIIAVNWKCPQVEIDIVAQKNESVYLVEVKHRSGLDQGRGEDYITKDKLRRMKLGAKIWVSSVRWKGDICLLALSSGPNGYDLFELFD